VPAQKKVIFITSGSSFADSYAGKIFAQRIGGTLVQVGNSRSGIQTAVNYTAKYIGKNDKIYIFNQSLAAKYGFEKTLRSKGYKNIEKIAGVNKYDTAKKIAEKLNTRKGTSVVLVNGDRMPKDGTAIQSICVQKGYPVLYVSRYSLTKYTIQALKGIMPKTVYIVGDETQISSTVIKELQKLFKSSGIKIVRVKSSRDIKN
jgi:putative cell wall-binding protein